MAHRLFRIESRYYPLKVSLTHTHTPTDTFLLCLRQGPHYASGILEKCLYGMVEPTIIMSLSDKSFSFLQEPSNTTRNLVVTLD